MKEHTAVGREASYCQALSTPFDTGDPVHYAGSTTAPSFNGTGSPLQVSWSVRPRVKKVNIATVGEWCEGNLFAEDHAHGVRNLVINQTSYHPFDNSGRTMQTLSAIRSPIESVYLFSASAFSDAHVCALAFDAGNDRLCTGIDQSPGAGSRASRL